MPGGWRARSLRSRPRSKSSSGGSASGWACNRRRQWPGCAHDSQADLRRIPPLFAQEEPAHRQASQPRHLQVADAVDRYLDECKRLGFDIVEVSSGFLTIPADDLARLTERVKQRGLEPKPEVNVQHGAGGSSPVAALEEQGGKDVQAAIDEA